MDSALAVAVTGFCIFHFKLVLYNQTTIESDSREFDIGWRANFESVMGRNPYLWFLPVYGNGPVGDGVHWQRRQGGRDVELGQREVDTDEDE